MLLSRAEPAELPFDLALLKRHCRVDSARDEDLLSMYAWAAIRHGEFITNRVWAQCEWQWTLNKFPQGGIEIPVTPCTEITSITYVDADLVENPLDPEAYIFTPSSLEWVGRPYAKLAPAGAWPVGGGAATISFKAGWSGQSLPLDLVNWIFVKVSGKFEQREDLASATRKIAISFPRDFADGLLDSYYLPKRRA